MDADLLVVGAGIAGSCMARAARAAGFETLLVADPARTPASTLALALVRENWVPGATGGRSVYRALKLYASLDAVSPVVPDMRYNSFRNATSSPDIYAVEPGRVLLEPDRAGVVQTIQPGKVFLADGTMLEARRGVVICAGVHNPDLGAPAHHSVQWGATLVDSAPGPVAFRLMSNTVREIYGHVVGPQGSRTGSAYRRSAEAAKHRLEYILEDLWYKESVPRRAGVVLTAPVAHTRYTFPSPYWRGSTAYIGGLGRVGYGLAPTLAALVVERYKGTGKRL